MNDRKPSDFELQILGVLWDRGPSTVREVWEALPDGKTRCYTSVLSVMQGMEKKGLLDRRREGMADRWKARQAREKITRPLLQGLVSRVFGGKPSVALLNLIDSPHVGRDELEAMRDLLDRKLAEQNKTREPK